MKRRFDWFVLFAEMRTGSNFLETNLNQVAGLTCLGEAFNPHFVGYPQQTELLGIDQSARDDAPLDLLERIRCFPDAMAGFRYFHDHDPRVLEPMLDDPRCAKIILTRNPADSYVSWKIARDTDQWKLTDLSRRKPGRARFSADEFETYVRDIQDFQVTLLRNLQKRGQTAFFIGYDDLHDLDALNGLLKWLGLTDRVDRLDGRMKRQNPEPLSSKVENYDAMVTALSGHDRFDLARTPNFEPRRGPGVPGFVAAARAPLLFQPIPGGPEAQIVRWLADLDRADPDDLTRCLSQKSLHAWQRAHPGHRSFTVLRHPVARAYASFRDKILASGPGALGKVRRVLVQKYGMKLADVGEAGARRDAFKVYLGFLKQTLDGQTPLRVNAHWCSQAETIRAMSEVAPPDVILREADLQRELAQLAEAIGYSKAPTPPASESAEIADIYDDETEARVRRIYARDYRTFGFSDWPDDRRQAALTRSASVRIV